MALVPLISPITISTLLRWTDSFITIDRAFDEPQIWTLPRLLSRVLLSRIEHVDIISNTRLLPETETPELFARVYTMTLLEFFSENSSPDDPSWLQAILHSYRTYSSDPIQTTTDITSYLPDTDMKGLTDNIETSLSLTTRTATDAYGSPVRYVPPPRDNSLDWNLLPIDEELIPGIRYFTQPLPDPPVFRLRHPDLQVDIGRNVSVICPDGTQISTYDTAPELGNINTMMQQMLQQLRLQQQALAETQEQARVAIQHSQNPWHVTWQLPYAPEREMADRSPSPYSLFGRRTPPPAFQQIQPDKTSPSSSSTSHTLEKFDSLHLQSPRLRPQKSTPSRKASQRHSSMYQHDAEQWGGSKAPPPKVESISDDKDEELRRRTEEMEQHLADARRQEQELSRSHLNSRHQSLAEEYAATMERVREMQRIKEYETALHKPNLLSQRAAEKAPVRPSTFANNLSSNTTNPQDARLALNFYHPLVDLDDAPQEPPRRHRPGNFVDRPEPGPSKDPRTSIFSAKPLINTNTSTPPLSTFQMINQFCDMMNKCGPAEAEHFRAKAVTLFPMTVSPPPVPGSWPKPETTKNARGLTAAPSSSFSAPEGCRNDLLYSAPQGSRSDLPFSAPTESRNVSAPTGSWSMPQLSWEHRS
ncbi:hypothetical protein BJ508DRAFT_332775 [Ascobolus immersus RN42]|uniref:Uncharacterized protein n=1 Tax=Ascobolus immersus RN42 TaxID=1160509 RepID=A0A3N4HYE8_ASCIM|nr:hypothetical protein BJ508DRAFT_332775 [Ascobolus immersus RN42]